MAKNKQNMYEWIRSADGQVQKVVCNYCYKELPGLHQIELHMRTHTLKKLFICEKCGKHFSLPGNLKKHTRSIHNGEKPFTCTICEKVFSQKGNLDIHMRVHIGKKPFICKICQRAFSIKSNLERHVSDMHPSVNE